ncbi:MAG: NADP-specific glutamate dehydrogenase [Ruminococcaceae bacterium]|nr:NADP-specific glutamate dehydrogenase [Oscillospiraceae bacterium]MBR3595762.1 NADP-specific glutamate dehydrogenase [Clostridia bacterium]
MNPYIERVIENVKIRNAHEPEFIQTVEEVFSSIEPLVNAHPEYEKYDILMRMTEPDRAISFRVTWVDDNGNVQVNRGYRYQFNSAIGPYKGGLRFHPSVYSGIIKFLGFEQTFKNSLTGLPIGGAKGGSNFDPIGKSDAEIMRFCQSFMTELYRYVGPDIDVPAGDIGVGGKEIGYLFGQYKRIKATFENGVLTGKGLSYGGSLIRPEATGFGAVYYLQEVLNHYEDSLEGKTVAISGFGNVAWGVATKMAELGAKVLTLSDPTGYIYDPDGVSTKEKLDFMLKMRAENLTVDEYAKKFGVEFIPGKKPWGVKADIIMPCATQNEVDIHQAKKIVANGVQYYIEVSNMPTTNDALKYLQMKCKAVAPSKAVNAGGVAVSALEMSQNSARYMWSAEKVDNKLHDIMKHIHDVSAESAEEYGLGYDLVAGANIAGFKRVAQAMLEQGII